jgi:hypothetical protein
VKFSVGTPKPLDGVSLQDVQVHPIWLWVCETGLEDQADDETWQCPVLDTTDVSNAMEEPVITLSVKRTPLFASASYNARADRIEAISVWESGAWAGVQESTLKAPITFVAAPTIRGVPGVEFVFDDPQEDQASRV